jgi:hypothetical protein
MLAILAGNYPWLRWLVMLAVSAGYAGYDE